MNSLLRYKDLIFEIKEKVKNNFFIDKNIIIDNDNITSDTISIIMTSSNRSKQTYFTLDKIKDSKHKKIQVIIVDDSTIDPIDINILKNYPFYINYITINKEKKNWFNPLVNYNIAFNFIKGDKIIIQNAEVCHVGDVLSFINKNIEDNNYYVCDVKRSLNFETNNDIYKCDLTNTDIYKNEKLYSSNYTWCQSKDKNFKYHFLCALTINTFKKIKEFSYDLCMGHEYDDNDFVLKIILSKINIVNLFHDECNIGGIHLHHSSETKYNTSEWNKELFFNKKRACIYFNNYIDVTYDIHNFDDKYNLLKKYICSIDKVVILGEKYSGINLLKHIIETNFETDIIDDYNNDYSNDYYYKKTDSDYKDNILFISVIRNPYTWINEIYKKNNLSLDDFLEKEYIDYYNDNEIMYKNIFEFRNKYYKYLIEDIHNIAKNNIIIKYEDIVNSDNNIINTLKKYLKLSSSNIIDTKIYNNNNYINELLY